MSNTARRRATARTTVARAAALLLALAVWPAVTAPPAAAGTFSADPVATGLDEPVAFTFAPDGRIFYVEKTTGEIRIYNPATDHDGLFYDVPGVNGDGERGMLGIALHPSYPAKPFVYVYATRMSGGSLKNQILRLTNRHGTGRDRRQVFSTAASSNPYHNGGRIEFGPDGQLYAIVGEGHDAKNAQDLSNPRGKILRMTPQGDRPADNPIAHSKIFVYGSATRSASTSTPSPGSCGRPRTVPNATTSSTTSPSAARTTDGARGRTAGASPPRTTRTTAARGPGSCPSSGSPPRSASRA